MRQFIPSAAGEIERYTPDSIFKGLGVRFDLDPCAPLQWCPSKDWCDRFYSIERREDGLSLPWEGSVWLNPPWTRGVKRRWIARLHQHGNGIACVRGGVDSKWLYDHAPEAIFLLRGRLRYLRSDDAQERFRKGGATGGLEPSLLLAYGPSMVDALSCADLRGIFVRVEGVR